MCSRSPFVPTDPWPARPGMTLLEGQLAVVIAAMGILVVLGLLLTGSVTIRKARALTTATFLAQEELERFGVALRSGTAPPTGTTGRYPPPFDGYTWTTTITRLPGSPLVRFTVTVSGAAGTRATLTSLYEG